MKITALAVLSLFALGSALGACGGSTNGNGSNPAPTTSNSNNPPPPPSDDGGGAGDDAGIDAPPPPDYGAPSSTYPAFKPEVGTLINNGGAVLSAPVIVTITWPMDPGVDKLEAFGDAIGGTNYWSQTTSEYGVGPASSGMTNHVRITDMPPTTFSDQDIDTFVANNAGVPAMSKWPAPTSQTIYVLYLHPSTSLQFGGSDACAQGVGGYHQATMVNGAMVSYAVVPRCNPNSATAVDEVTVSSSHEIGEASLDPDPQNAAYYGFDDAHLAWDLFQQGVGSENGDVCELYRDSNYKEAAPFAYYVQRLWSNKSGAAGHNPCVPVPQGAYFNTTPLMLEDMVLDLSRIGGSRMTMTKGYKIAVGETKTFPIGFYSDADTGGPWSIAVTESNPILGAPKTKHLTATVDKKMGQNGEKAYVTVTVTAAATYKAELLTVLSSNATTTHYMPILIGQ